MQTLASSGSAVPDPTADKHPFYCPVCEQGVAAWVPLMRMVDLKQFREEPGGRICPHCGSFERTRHIVLHLGRTQLLAARPRFLHIAPEPGLAAVLKAKLGDRYLTADLNRRGVDLRIDLTDAKLPDNLFDVIYCSNVLEHIPKDRNAMAEIFRLLSPGGLAIIQVPTHGPVTKEDLSITDPLRRFELYGQADHVRQYGRDVQVRLAEAGFDVEELRFPDSLDLPGDELERMNIGKHEYVHFCRKPFAEQKSLKAQPETGLPPAVFFGASKLGELAATELNQKYDLIAFADNDARKWGTTVFGRPVCAPAILRGRADIWTVVLTSSYHREILPQLRSLGFEKPEIFTPTNGSCGDGSIA